VTEEHAPARIPLKQWIVIFLLFLAACLNYIDRGSLSVGAPEIATELSLSPVGLGLLFSAFFWTYTGLMVVAGWLTDRYPVKWVFGIGFLLWSGATFASGFATSMSALLVFRLILGAGETVTFPVFSKIIAAGFPPERRALPNSLLDAGTKLGPAVGTLVGALLMARYGWRIMFFALGIGSLVWLIPWMIFAPRPKPAGPADRLPSPSLLAIIRRRDAWGTFIGSFSYAYGFYFLLTWLPTYLVNEGIFRCR
jgi:MFS family permease